MKKKLTIGALVLFLVCVAIGMQEAGAVGPLMIDKHTAAWDANTETDLNGYYVYWRAPAGTWDNARRSARVPVSLTPTYDLLQLNLPNGNYEIAVSALDNAGNESGMSNIVPFVVDLPAAPKNNRLQ
jgi:hypothetical protein